MNSSGMMKRKAENFSAVKPVRIGSDLAIEAPAKAAMQTGGEMLGLRVPEDQPVRGKGGDPHSLPAPGDQDGQQVQGRHYGPPQAPDGGGNQPPKDDRSQPAAGE